MRVLSSAFRLKGGGQSVLLAYAIFQVSLVENNPYAKWAYIKAPPFNILALMAEKRYFFKLNVVYF